MTFVHQHLEELDSTNNALWELSEKIQLSEFHTISTDYQWSGRGQDTNSWHSEKAQNILLSTLVFPEFLPAADAFKISQWISVSIFDFLKYQGIQDISIKWPNDIYVGKKKIAGILIQNAISGSNLSRSLIGIGLNINEKVFPDHLPNPISLFQLLQQELDLLEEMHQLMSFLKRNYELLKKAPQKITKCYYKNMFLMNEWAKYQINDLIVDAQIIGTDEYGRLALKYRSGELHHFDLKEVKFVL